MELLVRLILLPPLLVAAFNGMMGLFSPAYRKQETLIGALGTLAVALPFAVTTLLFVGMLGGAEAEVVEYFTWMAAGDLEVAFAYRIDELSLLMTMIVTGVGALIHLYSIGYMHGDSGFWRFFAYLNLFIFAMLNLVLAESLPVLFLGWEGVGLCSYLLIGYWYSDLKNSAAANKAFIVNRIGDFAFLLAMFIMYQTVTAATDGPFGLDFATLLAPETLALFNNSTGLWVVLLLFIGATGKSAQIPLFVWLPDAMAGPTPVSALIHAATMVTSGLYLLARLSPLVLLQPTAMMVVAVIGAATAIMAATIAITQNDIKKVLAYSTVSQLGYMFLAAGVGAWFVAIFHVMTHAFFKACLFLGSGSVIHAMHHVEHDLQHKGFLPGGHGHDEEPHENEVHNDPHPAPPTRPHAILPYDGPFDAQDMRTMGGLGRFMPVTKWTFLISTLAIAGIPLLSGFFSKDEILLRTFAFGQVASPVYMVLWVVGLITAILTAVYMTRAYLLTFSGEPRWPDALDTTPHESPATMTIPLVVLAGLAAVAGLFGLPAVLGEHASWIHGWLVGHDGHLGPVADSLDPLWAELSPFFDPEYHISHTVEWILLGLGSLIAIGGVAFAWYGLRFGPRGPEADRTVRRGMGWVYVAASRFWGVDQLYDATVVRGTVDGARKGAAPFDENVVDGGVMGLAHLVRRAAGGLGRLQTGVVQTYALAIVVGVVAVVALVLFV